LGLIATCQPGACDVGEQTVLSNNNTKAKVAGDGELKKRVGSNNASNEMYTMQFWKGMS
jgi:hypothetical protein